MPLHTDLQFWWMYELCAFKGPQESISFHPAAVNFDISASQTYLVQCENGSNKGLSFKNVDTFQPDSTAFARIFSPLV